MLISKLKYETGLQCSTFEQQLAGSFTLRRKITYAAAISPEECPKTADGKILKVSRRAMRAICKAVHMG